MNPKARELGAKLRAQFTKIQGERIQIEYRWLQDLRQYKGIYDPIELAKMDANQSKSFVKLTQIKVKSATARLIDLVFPAGSNDSWKIEPTPNPDMAPSDALLVGLASALGRMPTVHEIRVAIEEEAEHAAQNMTRTIKDQLVDIKYRRLIKQVIHSGNLFGTGLLKGPLVSNESTRSWVLNDVGEWEFKTSPIIKPYVEFVPVWESYPDSSATTFSEARFHYQRTVVPRHQLFELMRRDDFQSEVILKYLKEHRETDFTPTHWEIELRRLGLNLSADISSKKRYELLERWGVLERDEIESLGIELPMDESIEEYWANIFILGDRIIKAEIQPIDGVTMPIYGYYWAKDETSIFGEGIPAIMRDDQKGLNASVRAMMDNAAITAGPQFEVNVDLIHPDEDPRDVYPRKVWLRQGVGQESQYPAVRAIDVPSHTREYLELAQYFASNVHESTLPSFMHGEASSKGSVGRTVGGLSLLMTAAQITFKDQLFSIDDDVQKPFIEAMYHWNMQFNPDPSIKGDFNVKVKGTSSLVAREIRAQNLEQFAAATMNQFDAPYIDRQELNKQRQQVLELGDDIVLSKEQALEQQIDQLLNYGLQQPNQPAATQETDSGASGEIGTPGSQAINQVT